MTRRALILRRLFVLAVIVGLFWYAVSGIVWVKTR